MASELKLCPFCGGTDVNLHHSAKAFMSWVSCKSCGLDAPSETGVTDEEAITYWNTRPAPAATDTGLVTVGWLWEYAQYRTDDRGYYGYETVITENNPTDHVSPAEKLRNVRELVTRSQAEAIIRDLETKILDAAISDRLDDAGSPLSWQERAEIAEGIISDLKADNAAKETRIKELEEEVEWAQNAVLARQRHAEARCETLEAKLAAAEKALERMVSEYDEVDLSHDEPPSMTSAVMEARAVLGGGK